jgi:hypothetical protein
MRLLNANSLANTSSVHFWFLVGAKSHRCELEPWLESLAMSDAVTAKDLDFARIDEGLIERAIAVLEILQRHGRKVVSAESCTGGLIATVLNEAPGAAEHFEGGAFELLFSELAVALGR